MVDADMEAILGVGYLRAQHPKMQHRICVGARMRGRRDIQTHMDREIEVYLEYEKATVKHGRPNSAQQALDLR